MDNAEEYVDLMFDFCMHTGIQKQMDAFRGMHLIAYFGGDKWTLFSNLKTILLWDCA